MHIAAQHRQDESCTPGQVMGFFDDEKNVQSYIEMVDGYDGQWLIDVLKTYVSEGATVLELGMGPGKDCDILRQSYRVTGSDNSISGHCRTV